MLNKLKFATSIVALSLAAGCATVESQSQDQNAAEIVTEAVAEKVVETATKVGPKEATLEELYGPYGLDLSSMDKDVAAGDDFFRYANGKWYDTFEIPADKSRYGSFTLLRENSEKRVRKIIEELAEADADPSTSSGKIGLFYKTFSDLDVINQAGLAPAQPYLDRINAIENMDDLANTFAAAGYASPFSGYVFADPKETDTYIFQSSLSGLGLPDRDYYTKDDEKSVERRAKYVELLTFLLTEAKDPTPADTAAKIMALETKMAATHWDRAMSRNPEITYNKISMDDLAGMANSFPVKTFMTGLGLGDEKQLIVGEIPPTPEELDSAGLTEEDGQKLGGGFPAMFKIIEETDLSVWKAYLTVHFLSDHSSVLPTKIDKANFDFYGNTLRGTPEQRVRWKRAVSATENILGEAIGKEFVTRHFPEENKAAMDKLVSNLRLAMADNLKELEWMGDETRGKAKAKLDTFNPKIGYPEEFETYDSLEVSNDALSNKIAASDWQWKDNIAQLGTEMDRNEWFMTPQTINAYYNPLFNEIVFPAAILQPPFFNISADPAVNYGAIGGVIGHEIGHGFDDQGSKFNADGSLSNWWTEDDLTSFRGLTKELVGQYNGFCPLDDGETCVNGQLALGENIGDLGGLSLAYKAYKLSLNGEEDKVIDGLTGDQRFFMSWAQVWRSKSRDEALRSHLITGPHSPPYFRVNGPVRNIDAWYEAFGVTEDHALYLPPEKRIKIW